MRYNNANCTGNATSTSSVSISSYISVTDNIMGSIQCLNGIQASCALAIPYDITGPFVSIK